MNVKNGFSTLNRLLGKKSKSQTISKSASNLSIKSQFDTSAPLSSQLEQNTIPPVPITAANAPFEQTFRIIVLLPKDQFYVARLGAKTALGRLLILVCENKQLDPEKYEFRHPADSSQVFNSEQTIGAVGLSEIRLCHKSEAYDNFNADEIIKLRHTVGRDSLSSSELSSRNSKHTLKTASPYSSTNSLNSSDSAGMSINYRGPSSIQQPVSNIYQQKPPVAPTRKKRIAPRPPSQNSAILNGTISENVSEFKQPLTRKEFHASSPNLTQSSELSNLRTAEFHKSNVSVDCNGNTRNSRDNNNSTSNETPVHLHCNGTTTGQAGLSLGPTLSASLRPVSMSVLNSEIHYEEKELNGNREFNINGSAMDLAQSKMIPEPAPRKRIIIAKKKAPAPPPRGLQPVASPRVTVITEVTSIEEKSAENVPNENAMKNIPTLPNLAEQRIENNAEEELSPPRRTPEIADRKIIENGHKDEESSPVELISENQETISKDRKMSATLTNGYAEKPTILASSPDPTIRSDEPSPPLTPPPLIKLKLESKRSLETTSSDDDDQVKVYNLKLGKTIVQPLAAYENSIEKDGEIPHSPKALSIQTETTSPVSPISPASSRRTDSPEWSYTIPAPPKFADNDTVVVTYQSTSNCASPTSGSFLSDRDEILTASDIFITSDQEDGYRGGDEKLDSKFNHQLNNLENEDKINGIDKNKDVERLIEDQSNFHLIETSISPTPLENLESSKAAEVITELNNVINENSGMDRIIRRANSKEDQEIESVKPCALSNFKIQSYIAKTSPIEDTLAKDKSPDISPDEENSYIKSTKRPSLTLSNSVAAQIIRSRASITRSDSFHSTRYQNNEETSILATPRSTSYVSLVAAQQTNLNDKFYDTNRRKSSSELSIGESPSLQSLIVMKSILNAKKDSNGLALETDLKSPDVVDNASPDEPVEIFNSSLIENIQTEFRRPSFTDFVALAAGNLTQSVTENNMKNGKKSPSEIKLNHTEHRNSTLIETKISELENSIQNSKSIETKTTYDCDSSKENSPKNKLIISQPKPSLETIDTKSPTIVEPERIYKYQGPPSINLCTWHDRPKVQVAIKSDKDYKFSVVTPTPRPSIENNSSESMPIVNSVEQIKDPEPLTNKIPFVRSVEYKKATSMIQDYQSQSIQRKSSMDNSNQIARNNHPRPVSVNNQLILGRSMPKINRASFVPIVKGFTSIEANQTESTNDDSQNSIQKPTIVRSKSSVSTNILRLSTGNNIQKIPNTFTKDPSSPPIQTTFFSQTALRKTGLKEKILATNENIDTVPKSHTQRAIDQQNCAKLELKLTTTVTTSNQNSNFRQSIGTEIPPPPPPVIRSVVTKQNSLGKSACIPDTRDQLLSAIRNFNKTTLKRN